MRALEGTYSHLYKSLTEEPRVYSSKDVPWKGGPGHFGKSVISPQAVAVTQSIESHIEAYAPGASGQKHGHLNSAVFYVLKGHGHDVHDGRNIPWKAGDVMIVENGCVHQHFNDSKDEEARPAGVQGQAVVPVHAPAVPEDRRMAAKDSAQGAGKLQAAVGHLTEKSMTLFTDKGPVAFRHQDRNFPRRRCQDGEEFRKAYESKLNVVAAEDMPWEKSADGLIKHLVHHKLDTREMCVEAYMQFLKAGEKSGIHRHMWEEVIFVVEGSGYDLHWDMKWDCLEAFQWEWAPEPKAYGWKRGDYIYVPPFTNHQHVADDHEECRLIVMSNRIIKEMGFDWFDQVANARASSRR